MKQTLLIACGVVFCFIISCNSDSKTPGEEVIVEDTVLDKPAGYNEDSVVYIKNKALLWQVDEDINKLQKPKVAGIDTMSVQHIIGLINNNYDSIYLDYVKTSHDTVYVHIPHSEQLTERIGSTGAEMFMASSTYSLTELKGIKYVNYDFEEGDHASPGVYGRDSLKLFNSS